MNLWFPDEFGEEYRKTNLRLRVGVIILESFHIAFISSGGAINWYILLFLLPLIWSIADSILLYKQITIHPIFSVIFDLLFGIYGLASLSALVVGVLFMSPPMLFIGFVFSTPGFLFILLFFRSVARWRKESRSSSGGKQDIELTV